MQAQSTAAFGQPSAMQGQSSQQQQQQQGSMEAQQLQVLSFYTQTPLIERDVSDLVLCVPLSRHPLAVLIGMFFLLEL